MRKEQWINIRGLAILSVIIIHTTTMRFNSSSMLNNWINLFFDQVSRFAVPVFFMSSGFGLGLKHMTYIKFLQKEIKDNSRVHILVNCLFCFQF
ncbi:acyltransferase family protein [Enterococcus avium]|uniref:acyltransferase family protein n=1 Tax=Enterococcus avium TaxID=33945 RepID=UPI003DA4E332